MAGSALPTFEIAISIQKIKDISQGAEGVAQREQRLPSMLGS